MAKMRQVVHNAKLCRGSGADYLTTEAKLEMMAHSIFFAITLFERIDE